MYSIYVQMQELYEKTVEDLMSQQQQLEDEMRQQAEEQQANAAKHAVSTVTDAAKTVGLFRSLQYVHMLMSRADM
jgi:HPt (histidine-containing phosphotransfer) domain-containing protein